MSTSSELPSAGADPAICSFEYPAAHLRGAGRFESASRQEGDSQQRHGEIQRQLQSARAEGERAGEVRARQIFEEALRAEHERLGQTLRAFQNERQEYFRRVEMEIVQLSLTIARKVLHREAQVDKTLLMGLVRVSLQHLAESTGVVLRVHPSHESQWRRFFEGEDFTPPPQVIADAAVTADQCVMATQLGTTEIGIETQLKEIEQGLFDLVAQRPGAKAEQ